MEEVKHEEDELNNDKQLFLRQYKKLKEQSLSMGDHHNKKREYDAISPMMQQQIVSTTREQPARRLTTEGMLIACSSVACRISKIVWRPQLGERS